MTRGDTMPTVACGGHIFPACNPFGGSKSGIRPSLWNDVPTRTARKTP